MYISPVLMAMMALLIVVLKGDCGATRTIPDVLKTTRPTLSAFSEKEFTKALAPSRISSITGLTKLTQNPKRIQQES